MSKDCRYNPNYCNELNSRIKYLTDNNHQILKENINLRTKLEAAEKESVLLRQERDAYCRASESYSRQLEAAEKEIESLKIRLKRGE